MVEKIKKDKFVVRDDESVVLETTVEEPKEPVVVSSPVRLNLGCGFRKMDGYINIDNREIVKPDVCGDVFGVLAGYEDSSVDEIRAFDFMEHIERDKVIPLMREIHRVLKKGSVFHFFIPSTDGRGAFMDPTHVSFWNIDSWLYFCEPIWHALYPDLPEFRIFSLHDVNSSPQHRIIHTEGKVVPVK